ncbi:MAG: oligosaccharide flippase family protein [Hamadaea sp.]|uniref:oligosaccharide flippase family protein n=1 Tax=Hamadaea sp. TaxID=2024425 RepID=UPI0017DB504C|nr:oligosaccharide flippase family protein [Hamadaea sp.]NUT21817.1 oligosaccharide flippase family protein [Hamadaea sp.]
MTDTTVESPPNDAGTIGRKAAHGLGWGLAGNVGVKLLSFATSLTLARLLVPDDFGAYAVALAATQLVIHINDLGLIPAVIQWRGRLEEIAPTASTIAAGFSAVLYAGFWFFAPVFAELSGVPAATTAIRLFTLTILVDGITAVRSAYLLRTFQQRRYIQANLAGTLANGVAGIGLAIGGADALALAGGQVAASVTTGVLVFCWARLPVKLGIDRAIAKRLMAYGLPLAAGLGIESVLEQADKVVLGRFMGATVLGFYLLAYSISSWAPGMIGSAIRYVALPSFARLSEKDSDSLSQGVQRVIPLMVLGLVPIAVLVAVLAAPMVTLLYGARWLPATGPLRFLMILMVVRMLTGIAMDVLMSTGATRWTLLINVGWTAALLPALWLGTQLDGGRGVAVAEAAVGVAVAIPLTVMALRRAGVRLDPIPRSLVRPLFAGLLCAAVTLAIAAVTSGNAYAQLAVSGTAGMAVYVVAAVPRSQMRTWLTAIRGAAAR